MDATEATGFPSSSDREASTSGQWPWPAELGNRDHASAAVTSVACATEMPLASPQQTPSDRSINDRPMRAVCRCQVSRSECEPREPWPVGFVDSCARAVQEPAIVPRRGLRGRAADSGNRVCAWNPLMISEHHRSDQRACAIDSEMTLRPAWLSDPHHSDQRACAIEMPLRPAWLSETQDAAGSRESRPVWRGSCAQCGWTSALAADPVGSVRGSADDRVRPSPQRPAGLCDEMITVFLPFPIQCSVFRLSAASVQISDN